MLTETDVERFSIDKFIEGCLKLDWLDIHLRCQNTVVWAESISFAKDADHIERARSSFIHFIDQFCFMITKKNKAMKPPGMSTANFLKVKPIIEKLVASGDLKKDWLTLYENLV